MTHHSKDHQLLAEAYGKVQPITGLVQQVQKKEVRSKSGFLPNKYFCFNHEDYKSPWITKQPKGYAYSHRITKPFTILAWKNDEVFAITEANSLDQMVQDWQDYIKNACDEEEAVEINKLPFKTTIERWDVDGDSSNGYVLIIQGKVIAHALNAEVNDMTDPQFQNKIDQAKDTQDRYGISGDLPSVEDD